MRTWLRRAGQMQAGSTVVEVIVAVSVGALVMAALFPTFAVLNRAFVAWSTSAQALAIGLTAEEALGQDLRSYVVVQDADCSTAGPCRPLVLQALARPGDPNDAHDPSSHETLSFCITYFVAGGRDSGLPQLERTVSDEHGNLFSRSVIGHGVLALKTRGNDQVIEVSMRLRGADGGEVPVDPPIQVRARSIGLSQVKPVCL